MPVSPSSSGGRYDCMDAGGRAKQELEPRMGVIVYWMLVATD